MELLFEVYSEEIPAHLQDKAAGDLYQYTQNHLHTLGVSCAGQHFSTPRRVGFVLYDLPTHIVTLAETIRGPKTTANKEAIDGFMHKHKIDRGTLKEENGYFTFIKPSVQYELKEYLPTMLSNMLATYTWPRAMLWGDGLGPWIRPIKSLLALLDEKIIPVSYAGIEASDITFGNYFSHYQPLRVKNFIDYQAQLSKHNVMIHRQTRQDSILSQLKQALPHVPLYEDKALLEEIVGLVEQPFCYIGQIAERFMQLPKELLLLTLKQHQRYLMFAVNGELAPYFAVVSNVIGDAQKILSGNSKVLKARLSDAEFFYQQDLATPLLNRLDELKKIVYHQKLGSMHAKVERMLTIALQIAAKHQLSSEQVKIACLLSKCDLVTALVREMPELQGIAGYYYALQQKYSQEVAAAIRDHYRPQGPNDSLPQNILGAVVAIADKIDALNSLFAIGIKPTGAKDPFAQRRAAIGILRVSAQYNIAYHDLVSEEVLAFISQRAQS